MNEINGIINILKPTGMTSSDAVARTRGVIGEKRVGHLGTLDPLACGVLPIAVGKATRLFDVFLSKDKKYRAFFDFSFDTDTLDSDGIIQNRSNRVVSESEILDALKSQIGQIEQIPPQYSAKCVDGKRAYQLARENIQVELKSSTVNIYDIKIIDKYSSNGYVFDIHCGSGTYIRSIVRDVAETLGVFGYMSGLIRLSSGKFQISDSVTFDEFDVLRKNAIIPPETALDFLDEIRLCDEESIKKLTNGIAQKVIKSDGDYRLYFADVFCGIGNVQKGNLKITLNFLT